MFPMKKNPSPAGTEPLDPNAMDDKGGVDSNPLDDEAIGNIMNPSPEEGTDSLFGGENKLESALTQAGYVATPDQLAQIEGILKPVAGAKPPMGGAPKPAAPMGGAVPAAMGSGDLPNL